MAIALSLDPAWTLQTTTSHTSAAFSPVANSLIIVEGQIDGTTTPTVSISDSVGLTWTAIGTVQGGASGGFVMAWWAFTASARTNMTATINWGRVDSKSIKVTTYTGTASASAVITKAQNTSGTTPLNVNVASTNDGCRIRGTAIDWNANGPPTSSDLATSYTDAGKISGTSVHKSANTTGVGTSVTLNFVRGTVTTNAPIWGYKIYEIVPSGGGGSTVNGTATLSASGALTAGGAIGGTATLSASGTFAASSVVLVLGAATLSASGALTAGGAIGGAASLSGSGTFAASAVVRVPGSASMSATSTLVASTSGTTTGAATLSASGALAASTVVRVPGSASMSATSTLVASTGGAISGTASVSASSTLATSALVIVRSGAALSASGSLSSAGLLRILSGAALSASGSLSGVGRLRILSGAALSASGSLSATGTATGPLVRGSMDGTDRATVAMAPIDRHTTAAAATQRATVTMAAAVSPVHTGSMDPTSRTGPTMTGG